jgi:DNA transformation protein
MPKPLPELVSHALELLAPAGRSVRAKAMFGGHGLYVDELFVALVAFDRLYLKADEHTRGLFQAAGCQPFVYEMKGRPMTMDYFTAPEEAMESPAAMQPWARHAIAAALRARAAKPAAAPRKAKARPARAAPKAR